jgi:hypothetical protein
LELYYVRTMASSSVTKLFNHVMFSTFFITFVAVSVSPFQFQVGGERGWINPAGNETAEDYNKWAEKNRFHVGDVLCKFRAS